MTQTANEYWSDAQNMYDGSIPDHVRHTYETMRAKEEGKETPHQRTLKQKIAESMKMAAASTNNAKRHFELGNKDHAHICLESAQQHASYAANLILDLQMSETE